MKNNDLDKVIPEFFETITKKSWTWERLTDAERERFLRVGFQDITGSKKQRIEAFNRAYRAFLLALDYNPTNWREPASSESILF